MGVERQAREGAHGRTLFSGARMRILASMMILMLCSTVAAGLAVRQILLSRLDERVDDSLVQETQEFRRLVGGRNPATGRPFGANLRAIYDTYLTRNQPGEDEAILTFAGGELYDYIHAGPNPVELAGASVDRWAGLTRPSRGRIDTPEGELAFLAVPIQGAPEDGVFVVTTALSGERAEVTSAVEVLAAVSAAVLALASLAAFGAATRVLSPLRELTATARSIGESDLTRRIAARGDDEIAELGRTFNAMLDRLEKAFSSQRQFVNDAGHELRTPITIVRGHLELLTDDPEERRETIELVTDELDRMSRFVDDLLTLAKAEQPDFLRLDEVELAPLGEELLAKAGALAPRRWRLEDAADGQIVGDRQRLTQAVMNLAHNAVEHTGEGDAITLGTALSNGDARLWVRDEGPGVSATDQGRIFERFARSSDGRRSSEGAGLGLAIVRAIAEAHGGRVELRSRPGAGATFTVVVPTAPGTRADE